MLLLFLLVLIVIALATAHAASPAKRRLGRVVLTVLVILSDIIASFLAFLVAGFGGFYAKYSEALSLLLPFVFIQFCAAFLLILGYGGFRNPKIRRRFFILFALWGLSAASFAGRVFYIESRPVVSEQVNLWSVYRPFKEDTPLATLDEAPALHFDNGRCPSMDGATALFPVYAAFAQALYPEEVLMDENGHVNTDLLDCSTTTEAYRKIVDGEADVIFVADASQNQLAYAKEKGVELLFTPVGSEAFVFFVNEKNPLTDLSVAQARGIYSGTIRNWSELGIKGLGTIRAFQREEGSGSQTAMQAFMGEETLVDATETENEASAMGGLVEKVSDYRNFKNAIGYSFRFYLTRMVERPGIKVLSLEGVEPTAESIRNGTYPVSGNFYAVTRSDADAETLALVRWAAGTQGQELVEKTGYVPLDDSASETRTR